MYRDEDDAKWNRRDSEAPSFALVWIFLGSLIFLGGIGVLGGILHYVRFHSWLQ
jgi:hypothetical protein